MEKIKLFQINHDEHKKGFYLSNVNGDIYTYDLRFKTPNGGDYLKNAAMHSVEHLFATVIRSGKEKDNVIYFGPMGCRTGFYLLLRNISFGKALEITVKTLRQCLEVAELPGSTRQECGNYKEHDIEDAKKVIAEYLAMIC
jgi:S-ribosylhomocysteine lyase